MRRNAKVFAVAPLAVVACGEADQACINTPCPMLAAVVLTLVDSTSGASIGSATYSVAGEQQSAQCVSASATTCTIYGGSGTYSIDLSAPGYRTVHRDVVVPAQGIPPRCGCGSVATQRVSVAMPRAG